MNSFYNDNAYLIDSELWLVREWTLIGPRVLITVFVVSGGYPFIL